MNQAEWDAHWRSLAGPSNKRVTDAAARVKELVETYGPLRSNRCALDLACGSGANALWMAEGNWNVTAVDRASTAIDLVHSEAAQRGLAITTRVADLEAHEFTIEPNAWDLIVMCRYLQRDLFKPACLGLTPGGLLVVIVLLADPTIDASERFRIKMDELSGHFSEMPGFTIVHQSSRVSSPDDYSRRQAFAEIAIRREQ